MGGYNILSIHTPFRTFHHNKKIHLHCFATFVTPIDKYLLKHYSFRQNLDTKVERINARRHNTGQITTI
jgi:hypothetical protein